MLLCCRERSTMRLLTSDFWHTSRPVFWPVSGRVVIAVIFFYLIFSSPALAFSSGGPPITPIVQTQAQQNEVLQQMNSQRDRQNKRDESYRYDGSEDDAAATSDSRKNEVEIDERVDELEIKTLPELIEKEALPETVGKDFD